MNRTDEKYLSESLKKGDYSGDLNVDGSVILNYILNFSV